MALVQLGSVVIYNNATTTSIPKRLQRHYVPSLVRCTTGNDTTSNQASVRRSANYQPSIWGHDFIQSLENIHARKTEVEGGWRKLKEEVKKLLDETEGSLHQLELLDTLQRLGISHHFEDEIQNILKTIYDKSKCSVANGGKKKDLHATALEFRLLRQHGFHVPQDVFNDFKNETKNKFQKTLRDDCNGLLSLYEASYLSTVDERILKEARTFAAESIKDFVAKSSIADGKESYLVVMARHALEMPYHWRPHRLESRWYMDVYGKKQDMNRILLAFAKLDFNILQAVHQNDLKYASEWWENTGLGKQLHFARDRIMENYLWTIGLTYEPQFTYFRRMMTEVNALITAIDDIYDVYGTVEELEVLTEAVEKWDVKMLQKLPEYMRLCFLVLYNTTNQMGFEVLRERGFDASYYLRKTWADLCKAYLVEAKWYKSGYKPSLGEYMENAWISISAPLILVHGYCFLLDHISKETLDSLSEYHNLVRWSSMVLRLANDLATSPDELKRGDVPKSVQCYMNETGASEADARDHILHLIGETWDKMNKERTAKNHPFSARFVEVAMNLARMAQCMYQYGDGHGIPDRETKHRVLSLLIQPISLD